jgi:iron-sulfur cluster repair protein YtfE (RIC family)
MTMSEPRAKTQLTMAATQPLESTLAYEGAARLGPFQILVAEHALIRQEIDRALEAVRKTPPPRRTDRFPQAIVTLVELHTRREERVLYPICERLFGGKDGAAAVMREDHAAIKVDLAALTRSRKPAEVRRAEIEQLKTHVEAHFAKEEHVLFPLMAALVSNPEATALARLLRIASTP